MLHEFPLASNIAALCGSDDPLAFMGILGALFGAGFVGSFAHCATMCGPFVLMQVADADDRGGLRRSAAALLSLYHLGRLSTYIGLGTVAGALGASIAALTAWHWVVAVPLAIAAMLFLLQAVSEALPRIALPSIALGSRLGTVVARAASPLLRRRRVSFGPLRSLALGLVLGFLPCGFLYAALAAAAATGTALGGAAAMAGFGLGTVPALALVGMLGHGAAQRWRRLATGALPLLFLLNAITLGGLALHLVA